MNDSSVHAAVKLEGPSNTVPGLSPTANFPLLHAGNFKIMEFSDAQSLSWVCNLHFNYGNLVELRLISHLVP